MQAQATKTRSKAAVYVRVSSERQEKWSPDAQRRVLLDHCARMGWDPVVYSETGSGETLVGRPEIQRLLKDAQAKRFSVCLVIEQERLSRDRDLMDWLIIVKTFRDAGIQLATPAQTYNLADAEDAFLTNLFGVLSAREKHKMLERTMRGRIQAKKAGKYLNEFVVYGFAIEGGQYVHHPVEAEVVRMMARMTTSRSCGFISDHLNAQGIKTKTGVGKWYSSTVHNVLTNRAIMGEGRYGDLTFPIPPILSQEEWDAVQRHFRDRFATRKRPATPDPLLKGFLRCALCGRHMWASINRYSYQRKKNPSAEPKFHAYYVCYGHTRPPRECPLPHIRADVLETRVWDRIRAYLQSPKLIYDALNLGYAEKDSLQATKSQEEAKLDRQLDGLARQERGLIRGYYGGETGMTEPAFRAALQEIQQERKILDSRRQEVGETPIPTVQDLVSLRSVEAACAEISQGIDRWDRDMRREALCLLVEKITVFGDRSSEVECRIPILEGTKSLTGQARQSFKISIPPVLAEKAWNRGIRMGLPVYGPPPPGRRSP